MQTALLLSFLTAATVMTLLFYSILGTEVTECDICPLGDVFELIPLAYTSKPHSAIIGCDEVECCSLVVVGQSVNLDIGRDVDALTLLVAECRVSLYDMVDTVGCVLHPCHLLLVDRCGIECLVDAIYTLCATSLKLHIAELRVDTLGKEEAATILCPPDASVDYRTRASRNGACVGHSLTLACGRIGHNKGIRGVESLAERENRLIVEQLRIAMLGIVTRLLLEELCRGVWLVWKRVPVVIQVGKGLAEELMQRKVPVIPCMS